MKNKLISFIKDNWILIAIFLLGIFLRTYKSYITFSYAHDTDLAAWIVRDVVTNKHLRLIGQETSTAGIFIGPFYYYLQIPFYLLFNMEPVGLIYMATLLGVFNIWSFYYIFTKSFNKKVGLVAAFIYSVSFSTVINDRGTVPTTPVFVWTAWLFYSLHLIIVKKQTKAFVLLGILTGLIWHINFGLIVCLLLVPLALYFSKEKIKISNVLKGLTAFIITSIPLIIFETKHGFPQVKSLIASLTTSQGSQLSLIEQTQKVIRIFKQIVSNIVWYPNPRLYFVIPVLIFTIFVYFYSKRKIEKSIFWILTLWSIPTLVFFSAYSKIVSEYYLNGLIFAWIAMLALVLSNSLQNKNHKYAALLFIVVFTYLNVDKILNYHDDHDGYVYKRQVVAEIKKDAREKGYPCVAVSYITKPGYNLGYRYLFVLEDMHVNNPESLSPVYTIVYPLNDKLFPADKTFGSIGLIYPDYKRYTKKDIEHSCSGMNSNLTNPMFGFTE